MQKKKVIFSSDDSKRLFSLMFKSCRSKPETKVVLDAAEPGISDWRFSNMHVYLQSFFLPNSVLQRSVGSGVPETSSSYYGLQQEDSRRN